MLPWFRIVPWAVSSRQFSHKCNYVNARKRECIWKWRNCKLTARYCWMLCWNVWTRGNRNVIGTRNVLGKIDGMDGSRKNEISRTRFRLPEMSADMICKDPQMSADMIRKDYRIFGTRTRWCNFGSRVLTRSLLNRLVFIIVKLCLSTIGKERERETDRQTDRQRKRESFSLRFRARNDTAHRILFLYSMKLMNTLRCNQFDPIVRGELAATCKKFHVSLMKTQWKWETDRRYVPLDQDCNRP